MVIVFPENTDSIIGEIRETIGRTVEFRYTVSSYECSGCSLDPVTGTSDNSFCPICSGDYYIHVISGFETTAVITWGPSDRPEWETGGQMLGGDCVIQVNLDDDILNILESTENIIVDGKVMEIRKKQYRGVKSLNRMLISLIEKENE
jgi:hypothetical protein